MRFFSLKKDPWVLLRALQLIYRCDRRSFVLKVIYTALLSILPLVNLVVLKYLIDGITSYALHQSDTSLVYYVGLFCGIFLFTRLITTLDGVNTDILTQKLVDYINNLIQEQSVRLDMAYYDNPEYHDTFHRAQQEAAFRPVRILDNFVSTLGAFISLCGVVAMLVVASWKVIVVMVVAVLPAFVVKLYKSRKIYAFRRDTTQQMRRSHYIGQLLSNRTYAQEVRSFGLQSHLRDRYLALRRDLVGSLFRISRRLAVFDALTAVIETASIFFIILILVRPALTGAITIGSFVVLFEAFRRSQGFMSSLVGGISGLFEHKLFIGNLYEFLRLEPTIVSPQQPVPFPSRVEKVEFSDVTFSYPDMKTPTLSHFNFRATLGEISHLEGENGFGKSTALKLLLRLYDPQQGAILINGTDIRCFDLQQLRRGVGAIFQDHVRFYFTAKENVEFGDLSHRDDIARMEEALAMSEAKPVVDRLSKGIDTPLGRMFDHGEELSMGQWQRLALARQLYSNAPVLVFDEPTAWMDAHARQQFMQHLEELKTDHLIILISHI